MMGLQFARTLFDCKILAADIDPNKLQAAQGAGADEVYNTSDELSLMKLIEDTQGGVKAAVDFVGAEKTIEYAFNERENIYREFADYIVTNNEGLESCFNKILSVI